jgi:hypothetical protein
VARGVCARRALGPLVSSTHFDSSKLNLKSAGYWRVLA